ncbi:hypothetical protein GIB67_038287 [Kingdonia uniflora]|uniref:SAM-dependent MTase DRM-type domain-containing protein n=1 Tax=Kingdonia uniflora TaxID=39325 RepID=A0A7J7LI10_9MAGN|nr:hypothetical protein GIB67_038287 [Kingdonia uniflora]
MSLVSVYLLQDNQSHIEDDWNSLGERSKEQNKRRFSETPVVNTKGSSSNGTPLDEDIDFKNMGKGKMPKLEYPEFEDFKNMGKGKMPKHEYPEFEDYSNSSPLPLKDHNKWGVLSKPPYFFYGNVMDVSHDTWDKIIKFLYAVAPETANTEHFSALNRKEGYIHNLPKENRFHILPGPPMSIQDAIPHTKKWWPSWDNRKLLSSICPETRGISQLCERLRKILVDSQGMVSKEQQTDIFHHCKTMNLLWVGLYKLGPIEPEHLEHILGYPLNHTQVGCDLMERLSSLKHCFQTDALGFHLSSLKWKFPEGLTVLSLYSGIGGAEVALHRLGLRLKCVVSVETSETNRRILKRWWGNTQQTGELVQIDDIGKLSGKKLDNLIEEFGGFDFVICQNPSAYNSGTSKVNVPDVNSTGIDFSLFYEFVRVLQHVRSTMALR